MLKKHFTDDPVIFLATQRIRDVLARSAVPEDAGHAENSLNWLLLIHPGATRDVGLCLATLAHDIERARPDRLKRSDFDDYDTFKTQHAAKGADIADALLASVGVNPAIRADVHDLIRRHEHGGTARSNLLKDADSLSYFDHNLPLFYQREGWAETLHRAQWGYRRLSHRARHYYDRIRHQDESLQQLLVEAALIESDHRA